MKTKAEDLINWGQLSRLLSGSRQTVRKNSIPKIHEPFINSLLKAINKELSKLPDTAKAGGQKENKTCTDVDLKNEQPLNLQNVSGSATSKEEETPAHNCPYCSHKSYLIDEHFAHIEMFHSGKPLL